MIRNKKATQIYGLLQKIRFDYSSLLRSLTVSLLEIMIVEITERILPIRPETKPPMFCTIEIDEKDEKESSGKNSAETNISKKRLNKRERIVPIIVLNHRAPRGKIKAIFEALLASFEKGARFLKYEEIRKYASKNTSSQFIALPKLFMIMYKM